MSRSSNWTVSRQMDHLRWSKLFANATLLKLFFFFYLPLHFPQILFYLSIFQMAHLRCCDNSQLFSLRMDGCMSVLGDVSKMYKQSILVSQDNFPLSAVTCLDVMVNSHSHSVWSFLYLFCLPLPPPLEVAGVSEAYEDAANCLWLMSNSKPCANCKSPIQKNEGCNHMQCAKVSLSGTFYISVLLMQFIIIWQLYLRGYFLTYTAFSTN